MKRAYLAAIFVLVCALFLYGQNGFAYKTVDTSGCLVSGCHTQDEMHGVQTHSELACNNCHISAAGGGTVYSSKCIVCHPIGNTGQCNLVKLASHASVNCASCHTNCSKKCPAAKVLGDEDPRLETLRKFRDTVLAKSAVGRKIIQIYYNNADSINAALDRSPALRALTRRVLEVISARAREDVCHRGDQQGHQFSVQQNGLVP